ncbi:hypothetical protein ACTFIV_006539 [Dictyostelium citrinum]
MANNTGNLAFFTPNGTGYYNFCIFSVSTFKPYCDKGSVTSYMQISPYGNNNYNLTGGDFLCLPKVGAVFLTAKTIVSQFFTSQWPVKVSDIRISSNSDIQFAKPSRSFRIIQFTIYTQPQPTIVYFSWFINSTQFYNSTLETTSPFITNTSHLIYYENDLQNPWILFLFRIVSMNIPSFEKITIGGLVTVNLNPGFNKTSFLNLKTAKNISTIELNSKEISPFPEKAISEIVLNPLTLNINIPFETPIYLMDISSTGVKSLTLYGVGRLFTLNGLFPLKLPLSLDQFTFSFGYIETLDLIQFRNITSLALTNNLMTGVLPKHWDSDYQIVSLDLTNNNLTGTIDQSYCNLLDFRAPYNLLTGEIPSCFTCFFDRTIGEDYFYVKGVQESFTGNNFTNFDNPPPCTTLFISKVVYDGINSTEWSTRHIFHAYGNDLGGGFVNGYFYTQIPENFRILWEVEVPNKVLIGWVDVTEDLPEVPRVFTIPYPYPLPTFWLSWDPLIPQIENVTWSNDTNLYFYGSFFSYDKSIIEIEIGGEKCIISSVTFFEINCTFLNVSLNTIDILTYITVGDLTNQITLTPNHLNIIYNCSENYNDCNGNGYCRTSDSTCICDSKHQGLDCTINYQQCPNDCSGFGSCNNITGICTCFPSHQSSDCSLPFKECPMDASSGTLCSGFGSCNNQTGNCACDSNHQSSDCSLPFKQCPIDADGTLCSGYGLCSNETGVCTCIENRVFNDCSGIKCSPKDDCNLPNGICDYNIGKCKCLDGKWSGNDCMIPFHYVSSIIPSSSEGGEATFFGFFGNVHTNLSITIGGIDCKIINYSSDSINCSAPAGTGKKSITIIQNNISFISDTLYQYQITNKPCPNDCTGIRNGKCNSLNGYCECNENWKGIDCRFPVVPNGNNNNNGNDDDNEQEVVPLPQSNSTIDKNTGSVAISNQQISYEISIVSLVEQDINGLEIYSYSLINKWDSLFPIINNQGNNIYQFNQTIIDKNCTIKYTIEEVLNKKNYSFADLEFSVDSGSIKMNVTIENYQYSSNLNNIQLRFKSSVGVLKNTQDINECNDDNVEIDTIDRNGSLEFILIKKQAKVLNGRFIDRILSDGRSTYMSTTLISKMNDSLLIGMNFPHCKTCIIDPDFSVLISPDFKIFCGDKSKKNNWLIPIVVIMPTFALFLIVGLIYLFYRKVKIERPLKTKLKSISMKNK